MYQIKSQIFHGKELVHEEKQNFPLLSEAREALFFHLMDYPIESRFEFSAQIEFIKPFALGITSPSTGESIIYQIERS
ncbi:hypothetical protein [Capybara microvirus Cap1_SP_61]|nr:hypothetical protein [Capybara microvirus Cap1_SP_61]